MPRHRAPAEQPPRPPPEGPPRVVCRCMGVSSLRIAEAAVAGAREPSEITRATTAGAGCGACRAEIREILAAIAGGAVSEAERRAQLERSQLETEKRVESCLYLNVVPGLPADVRLELVSIRGLEVALYLGADDPALRADVAEKLRRLVCPDLQVYFA